MAVPACVVERVAAWRVALPDSENKRTAIGLVPWTFRVGADLYLELEAVPMPRELIEPHKGDKRYVRRSSGKFTKSQDSVGRSLSADRRRKAKRVSKKGEGDRGDRRP
jgi:hypothetical protein